MLWPNKIFMSWRSIMFLSTGKRGSLLNGGVCGPLRGLQLVNLVGFRPPYPDIPGISPNRERCEHPRTLDGIEFPKEQLELPFK